MGASFDKDKHLDLYMEVDKPFYIAGELLQGSIYINAKQNRQYAKLILRLQGQEYIRWTEQDHAHHGHHHGHHGHHGHHHRRVYENTHPSYDTMLVIYDFNGEVKMGQYMLPFSLVLPATMSGSFTYSENCYIKYTLTARLDNPWKASSSQLYEVALNIQEPMRMAYGEVKAERVINAKCCGCCMDYGNTRVEMRVSKNFATSGDKVMVAGTIDNSQGTTDIEGSVISLIEKRVLIAGGMKVRNEKDNEYVFEKLPQVSEHGKSNFQTTIQIPNLNNYTAIGRVTARYFVLRVQTSMGCCMCCTDMPYSEVHLVIQSAQPSVLLNKKLPPPDNWNPQTFPKVECLAMSPFIYQPLPAIPYRNQSGNTSPIVRNQMMSEKALYPNQYQM